MRNYISVCLVLFCFAMVPTSAFAASSGTIDCHEKNSVTAFERPGSIVVIQQLSCDQKVSIIGMEQGYVKVKAAAGQSGFVAARYVRMLETQDAPERALESAPVTGFAESQRVRPSEAAQDFLTKNDAHKIISSRKSEAVSFLLSALIPGGGQYYNGLHLKGALMTGISVGAFAGALATWDNDYYASNSTSRSLLLVGLGGWLWSMIDAPISSNKINRDLEIRLLSWDVNKKMNISIKPDVSLAAPSPTAHSLNYGARLTLTLK